MTKVKEYLMSDIFNNIRKRKKNGDKWHFQQALSGKIMKMYFKEAKDTMFNGFEFRFPVDFGTMYIKQSDRLTPIKRKSKISKAEIGEYNIKRLGKSYKIVIEGGVMKQSGYKLLATKEDKKKLGKILCNTNIEYRTNLAIR